MAKDLFVVLMALVMGGGFGAAGLLPVVLAETNATDQVVPVSYLDSQGQGPPHHLDLTFPNVAYNPDFTGWCTENHLTAAGKRFYHAHTWNHFPFQDTTRYPYVWVTAEMCDWYWDNELAVEDPPDAGWDRKAGSTATTAYNCHGYALWGGSLKIADGDVGQGKIIADGYTWIDNPVAGCVASWSAHSFKVLATSVMPKPPYPRDLERHTEDKFGSSAIYQFMDSPGYGLERGSGNYYEKN